MLARNAKAPVVIPAGVEVTINGSTVSVKGPLGSISKEFNSAVTVTEVDNTLTIGIAQSREDIKAQTGTVKALLNNMVVGVTAGFERKLTILGVGYKAQAQGANLNLSLGFSHPLVHIAPEGIKMETPTPTEVIIKGIDKHMVGQVASEIRAYRPVEPYKGKGVRYADEVVIIKETKKK